MEKLQIADKSFSSRLFVGTGKFSSSALMSEAVRASGSELVTVALKRVELENPQDDILSHLDTGRVGLLPNTSGVRNAREAVFAAQLAREALGTNWMKLEIHPDPRYLFPDPVETLKAAEELVKDGFVVMPYVHADRCCAGGLEDVGVACVMRRRAIGSNRGCGPATAEIIIEQARFPSSWTPASEPRRTLPRRWRWEPTRCSSTRAIAVAADPVAMAGAFRMAVEAGRTAFEAQLAPERAGASAHEPLNRFWTVSKSWSNDVLRSDSQIRLGNDAAQDLRLDRCRRGAGAHSRSAFDG